MALNFGESLGARSKNDKLNKLHISLKEMLECRNNIRIQIGATLNDIQVLRVLDQESLELTKIIRTIILNTKQEL